MRRFQGVDLFAGAGGLSLGAHHAGIPVVTAVEINPAAAATYRSNHPGTLVVERDISKFTFERPSRPAVQLILFGGPPCQGFSTSNQKTRNLENPRNWLFMEFFRVARIAKPDWIVLENVKGLTETADGLFEDLIFRQFKKLGYRAKIWRLAAQDFGVPQRRVRLFFVGSLHRDVPSPPPISLAGQVSVREAIGDLPELHAGACIDMLPYPKLPGSPFAKSMRGELAECTGNLVSANNALVTKRYPHIPQGGNWCDIPRHLMRNYSNLDSNRSRHTGIYRRLEWDKPSIVIANYRKNMLIHPEQHRGLSVREAARLQSFPDDFRFSGSIGMQQQQVSNAVPPMLASAVFNHIVQNA